MYRAFRTLCLLVFLSAIAIVPLALAQPIEAQLPEDLVYVESSDGLVPPELEGGHTEVEMGDVDADGNPDLVSIGDHGAGLYDEEGIMVWFGDGTGQWNWYKSGVFGYGGIALGDVNNDGFIDVGYGMHHNYGSGDFGDQIQEVALGDGTGQNWTPWDDGLASNGEDWGMFGTDFADVDNDGDLDLGSISFGCCAGVHVYLNQGDGTWQQSFGFLGGNSDNQFSFGDVNGDGNADLAVNHSYGTVYFGDGTGVFTLAQGNLPPADNITSVALGDVNHDGRDELGVTNDTGGVQVWAWLSLNTWQNISGSLPTNGPYEAIQLFNMDMDAHSDVIAFGTGQVRLWVGDGAGGWTQDASFNTPSPGYEQAFRVGGDMDHNGFPDIVLVSDEGSWPSDQNHMHFYRESSTPVELSVKPVSPTENKSYRSGSVTFIDWISAVPGGAQGQVSLELSIHGPDGPWEPVANALPNNGRFQWLIPPSTLSTNDAYIRYTLTVSGDSVQAITPAAFNILGSMEEPIAGLSAVNDSPTILGQTTILTATIISGTNVLYAWDLGDGDSTSGAVVSHIYPDVGVYTATVTASNSLSAAQANTSVEVYEIPIGGLAAINDSPTILGETTILTATIISGTNVIFEWDLGDGITATGALVNHIYPGLGVYTATVTAINSVSTAEMSTSIEVYEVPISGLEANNDSPTLLGETTSLTATIISGTNVIFNWDFGDGQTAIGNVVDHVYSQAGDYTATVTANNSISSLEASTFVIVEEPISGLIPLSTSPTVLGETTMLTATVISGTNVVYEWDLGDGITSTGQLVSHIYPDIGIYTATVTASNAVSIAEAGTRIEVYEQPIASLEADNSSPTILGDATTLTATVASGTNVIYEWDFGDGINAIGRVVNHVYPHAGYYTAKVTAANAVSKVEADTFVQVEEPLSGLSAINDGPTILGETTILTAWVSSGTNAIFEWTLGDGTNAMGAVFSHIYPDVGIYTAIVTASNAVSREQVASIVEVYEEPIIGLTAQNSSPTLLGETTFLTATILSGTNVTYEWDLGDGTSVIGASVSHVYPDVGVYTATVNASNAIDNVTADTEVSIISPLPSWRLWLPVVTLDY